VNHRFATTRVGHVIRLFAQGASPACFKLPATLAAMGNSSGETVCCLSCLFCEAESTKLRELVSYLRLQRDTNVKAFVNSLYSLSSLARRNF
jgi:hypothetical protein